MSQLNATTPFTFLGSLASIPVTQLVSFDQICETRSAQTAESLPESLPVDSLPAVVWSSKQPSLRPKHAPRRKLATHSQAAQASRAKFPFKLMQVIQECKSDAIRWSADGRNIVIQYSSFQEEYLSKQYFKTSRVASFVRQLNLYGFRKAVVQPRRKSGTPLSPTRCRDASPSDSHVFFHPHFTRDNPQLQFVTRRSSSPDKSECRLPLLLRTY